MLAYNCLQVFEGNQDSDTVVYHALTPPITARFIRLLPVDWHNHISLRTEFYGCPGKWFRLPVGRYSWKFLLGVSRPVLQILTLFYTKKCRFSHPFSDLASKLHTYFQSWKRSQNTTYTSTYFRQKLCHLTDLLHSPSPPENHTHPQNSYSRCYKNHFGNKVLTRNLVSRKSVSLFC